MICRRSPERASPTRAAGSRSGYTFDTGSGSIRVLAILLLAVLVPAPPAISGAVAVVGDPAPGTGGGTYDGFGIPAVNESGDVVFRATVTGGTAKLCFQLLEIPELDDRLETPSMKEFNDTPLWNRPNAVWSWRHYLGPNHTGEVSPYAAPARAKDLSGLPPGILVTNTFDPLRDEGEAYGVRLQEAGVDLVMHREPGLHGMLGSPDRTMRVQAMAAARLLASALVRQWGVFEYLDTVAVYVYAKHEYDNSNYERSEHGACRSFLLKTSCLRSAA